MDKPFKYTAANAEQVVKFDIGDAKLSSGAVLWSDLNADAENGDPIVSVHCDYCVSDTLLIYAGDYAGSVTHHYKELTFSGYYETTGTGPVVLIGSETDTTISKLVFADARLKSAGSTSLAGLDTNADALGS